MAGRFALTGKKCLVTGGTKGIGRAILNEFVGLGAQVCAVLVIWSLLGSVRPPTTTNVEPWFLNRCSSVPGAMLMLQLPSVSCSSWDTLCG
jgi:hypothetical protein